MKMNRLLCWMALAATCFAATPLFRASFEIPEKSWIPVRGTAATDSTVLHEGRKAKFPGPRSHGGVAGG